MERNVADIVSLARRHVDGTATVATGVPRLILHQALSPSEPVPAFYEPSFCAIVQGSKAVRSGIGDIAYGAGQYLIAGFDVPVIGMIIDASEDEPYVCVQLLFDKSILIEMRDGMPPAEPITAIGIADTPSDLLDAVARFVGLLDHPADAPVLAPIYERELLYRLFSGPFGAQLRKFAYVDNRAAPIERAIAHLRKTYSQRFDVEQLLRVAGRSQSSLYRDFKDATGLSPLQFRTRLRLQEVRRLMLTERCGAAEAGFAVGYDSPAQLSRDYRKLYGRPPAEDISRLRTSTATPAQETRERKSG
ncbi:AraC family transcriptional regulator [Aurantiacibacter aquimixticola]|nr:AraC family transcriptional regulator [Aurantiacibacter aquimixticola]